MAKGNNISISEGAGELSLTERGTDVLLVYVVSGLMIVFSPVISWWLFAIEVAVVFALSILWKKRGRHHVHVTGAALSSVYELGSWCFGRKTFDAKEIVSLSFEDPADVFWGVLKGGIVARTAKRKMVFGIGMGESEAKKLAEKSRQLLSCKEG